MYLENQEDLHKKRREKREQVKGRVREAFRGRGDGAEEQTEPQKKSSRDRDKYDTAITVDTARIQHGKNNNRIYLMDIGQAEPQRLIRRLTDIAEAHHYEKIFAKVPEPKADPFLEAGYRIEARVPGLFSGETTGLFLGKFLHPDRANEALSRHYQMVSSLARSKAATDPKALPKEASIRLCTPKDAKAMAAIYKQVFSSYPFPVDDPRFIKKSMKEETIYAGVEVGGKLIALASAECSFDSEHLSSEMTDFATIPEHRGSGYASHLLEFLEREASQRGIRTAYTIARAVSIGMNITFSRAGYQFGGRLKNNTDIAGKIESMNVWYKAL